MSLNACCCLVLLIVLGVHHLFQNSTKCWLLSLWPDVCMFTHRRRSNTPSELRWCSVVNAQLWLLINYWDPHSTHSSKKQHRNENINWRAGPTYLTTRLWLLALYLRAIVWTQSRLWHRPMPLPVPFSSLCGEEAKGRAAHPLHKLWQVRFVTVGFI